MAKWETIKASAIKQAQAGFQGTRSYLFPAELMLDAIAERRSIWDSMDAANLAIQKRIQAWDIRVATKLRDLFPRAFPTHLRNGPLTAWLDEQGDWVIDRS